MPSASAALASPARFAPRGPYVLRLRRNARGRTPGRTSGRAAKGRASGRATCYPRTHTNRIHEERLQTLGDLVRFLQRQEHVALVEAVGLPVIRAQADRVRVDGTIGIRLFRQRARSLVED